MEDVVFFISKLFWIMAGPANLVLLGLWAGLTGCAAQGRDASCDV